MRSLRTTKRLAGAGLIALCLSSCDSGGSDPSDPNAGASGTGGQAIGNGSGGAAAANGQAGADSGAAGKLAAASGGSGAMPPVSMNAGSGGAAGNASGSGGATAPAALTSYKISIKIPRVAPGEEGTVCTQVRVGNTMPIDVIKLHNTLSPASHHFIVSKVTDPAGVEEPNAECTPFRGAVRGGPLSITQKHDDMIVLPEGVSYTLAAGQLMHLELHYLNTAEQTVDVMAESELFAAPAGSALQEATVLLIGSADIAIDPHAMASTGPKFTALPAGMEGVHFFAITGHTHRFGTNVTVSLAPSETNVSDLLYAPKPYLWDAPEMKHLEPAITVPAGGGFSFECSWTNPTDDVIGFGESALAEMCFFWAYYYPKKPVTNVLLDGVDISDFLNSL